MALKQLQEHSSRRAQEKREKSSLQKAEAERAKVDSKVLEPSRVLGGGRGAMAEPARELADDYVTTELPLQKSKRERAREREREQEMEREADGWGGGGGTGGEPGGGGSARVELGRALGSTADLDIDNTEYR